MQSKSKLAVIAGIAVLVVLAVVLIPALSADTPSDGSSVVYFTKNINSKALIEVYKALKWKPTEKVGVKISTGEPPNSNYLRAELIGDFVKSINGTFVECNTAYGRQRGDTEKHLQVAKDHGFEPIDIQDANGSYTLQVMGGKNLTENYVGASFPDYGSYVILSHFKGHGSAGYGGAIKNVSIGMASSEGKSWIHSGGKTKAPPWNGNQTNFLESMAEACKSVSDSLDNGKRMVYINVMNRMSVDCDCNGNPAEPDIHDMGIMASTDPVALDQACIDMVFKATDGTALRERITSRSGIHTIEHAADIGLGSRKYKLITL